MNTVCYVLATLVVFAVGAARAQDAAAAAPDEEPGAREQLVLHHWMMEDIRYAELLNEAHVTYKQLQRLADLQRLWEQESELSPELAGIHEDVLESVLQGKRMDEALEALGPLRQQTEEKARQVEQSSRELVESVFEIFTEEQQQALAAFHSPLRQFQHIAGMLARLRQAPEPQWTPFKGHVQQALTRMRPDGGEPSVTPEMLGKMLDDVRALPDEEFAKLQPQLAWQLGEAVHPDVIRQLRDPELRKRRLRGLCEHLLKYRNGLYVVTEKLYLSAPAAQ